MLKTGTLLDGKYKILDEIGRGGMSVVYLALNERANKTWAVKEIRKDGGRDTELASRGLTAETEMLKKLNHPNLPSIVDVIDLEDSFIIVMDYIEGNSLQDLLDTDGAQSPEKVIGWARQLCDVLCYLHSRRPPIIYRDMKPANIMLRPTGDVMLIDFGTAREFKNTRKEDTTCLGTRGYAAPEQFGGRGQTDARTDIYNLGATLYHLITGYNPADTNYVIHPVGRFLPYLRGSGIEKIILRCCRPDPEDRFQNCRELLYALDHVHDGDEQAVRIRNIRLFFFLTSTVITVFITLCGLSMRYFYSNSLEKMYDSYLSDAERKGTLIEKIKDYRAAIECDPRRPEAWDEMIRELKNNTEEKVSTEEADAVRDCIRSGASGESNLDRLKKSSRKTFARFNYDFGMILFFSSDNGRKGAFGYLGEAVKYERFLDKEEAGIAEIVYELARSDAEKTVGRRDWSGGGGYKKYWEELKGLLDGATTTLKNLERDSGGGIGYPLAICSEVSNALLQDLSNFKSQGVSEEEIKNVLLLIKEYLEEKFGILSVSLSVPTGGQPEHFEDPACLKEQLDRSVFYRTLNENMKGRVQRTVQSYFDASKAVEEAFGKG